MATLTSALNTVFTPTASAFNVQVVGKAYLQRRNSAADPWVTLSSPVRGPRVIANAVLGAQYQFVVTDGTTPVVKADQ